MVGRGDSEATWDGRPGVDSYVAWDGSRHIGPPPDGWYLASDHRWWPTTDIIEAGADPDPEPDSGLPDPADDRRKLPDPGPAASVDPTGSPGGIEDRSDWAPSSAPSSPDRTPAPTPAGRPTPPAPRPRRRTNAGGSRTASRLVASLFFGAIALGRCAFDTDSFDDSNRIPPDFTIPTISTLGLPEPTTVPGLDNPFLVNGVDYLIDGIDCGAVDNTVTVFIANPTSVLRFYEFDLIIQVDAVGGGTDTMTMTLETGPVLPGRLSDTSFTVPAEAGVPVECIVEDVSLQLG